MKRNLLIVTLSCIALLSGCSSSNVQPQTSNTPAQNQSDSTATQGQSDNTAAQSGSATASSNSNAADSSSTTASTNLISEDEARNIALSDAQVTEENLADIRIKFSVDDGIQEYEVDFYSGNKEYSYDINAVTGEILSKDMDIENDFGSAASANAAIPLEEARQTALNKVPGATTNDIQISLDSDDGKLLYEGSIYYNQREYEFEIDAQTGQIYSWEEESIWD